jgi:hypothetical protein
MGLSFNGLLNLKHNWLLEFHTAPERTLHKNYAERIKSCTFLLNRLKLACASFHKSIGLWDAKQEKNWPYLKVTIVR